MKKLLEKIKRLGERIQGLIDQIRGKSPEPELIPEDQPHPAERINRGGDGLYKLDTNLYLLPLGIRAEGVSDAAVLKPDGSWRAHIHWPRDVGLPWPTPVKNARPDYTKASSLYHNERLTLRGVKSAQSGDTLVAYGLGGERLCAMTIIERGIRQEGRSKL